MCAEQATGGDVVAQAFRRLVGRKFQLGRIEASLDADYRSGRVFTIGGGPFGYTVSYRWAAQEQGPQLSVFESDRMSGERLSAIACDGAIRLIATAQMGYGYSADATPEQRAEAERACAEHNRRFYEDVERRGLLRMNTGAAVNAYLRSGGEPRGAGNGRPTP